MVSRVVVTTAHGAGPAAKEEGLRLAARLDAVFVPRDGRSLEDLLAEQRAAGAIVLGARRVTLFSGGQQFFFHPGTAALRIKNLLAGKPDQMIRANGLTRSSAPPCRARISCSPLRALGNRMPLSKEAVVEALRVGRRRVVLKERRESAEFARLGFKYLSGGRYTRVAYGVIEIK